MCTIKTPTSSAKIYYAIGNLQWCNHKRYRIIHASIIISCLIPKTNLPVKKIAQWELVQLPKTVLCIQNHINY